MAIRPAPEADILIVEDNPVDVVMTKLALKKGGFLKEPTVLDDGLPALTLLSREGEFTHHSLPDLVILDLNLKRVDGPEVLDYIRRDPHLKGLCVAILSSSPTDVMVRRASEADCYFSKPSDLDSFINLGEELMGCYRSSGCARQ